MSDLGFNIFFGVYLLAGTAYMLLITWFTGS